jgi:tetratricopeptide (TPR) repeat protein
MTTDTPTDDPILRLVNDAESAIAAGDWQRAYEISNRAISRGMRHAVFFMVRAQRMEEAGRPQFALEDYQKAASVAPNDARVRAAVGACATRLENYPLAVESYGAAAELAPEIPYYHYHHAVSLAHVGDTEAALRAHEKAVEVDPNFADSLASLSSIMARKGDAEKARQFGERTLALDPTQPTAAVALALLDMSERRYGDAEAKLSALLATDVIVPQNRPQIVSMLADALDGQKKYAEAFRAYTQANDELRRQYASKFGGNLGIEAARSLVGFFENERPARWQAPGDGGTIEGAFENHVFLLGFMRSGTTLLEQVLASNPDVVALEEKGLLIDAGNEYLSSVPGLESLAIIQGEDLAKQRRNYWKKVREHLPDSSARIFVDKQPLNTTRLALIAKLFPKARILFAIRDPRDVVFSCFRRHLKVTGTQYEFLSLDSCARIYSLIMRIGEICRDKMPVNVLEHRYEDMVQDFDGRVRAVCDFIGVEWSETMRNFDEHASIADLRSPSALQVRRPLYGEGIGQWRRYGEQLKPVLPILEPWVVKFGYPRD